MALDALVIRTLKCNFETHSIAFKCGIRNGHDPQSVGRPLKCRSTADHTLEQ